MKVWDLWEDKPNSNHKIKEVGVGNSSKEVLVDNNKEDGAINQSTSQITSKTKVDMEVSKADGEETRVVSVIKDLVQVSDIERVFMIHRCTVLIP